MSNNAKPTAEILTDKEAAHPVAGSATPTEAIIKASNATATMKYGNGHVMVVGKPDVIASHWFPLWFGNDSTNQTFMATMFPLLWVKSIDGRAIEPFSSELDIRALLQELDNDGKEALDKYYFEHVIMPKMDKLKLDDNIKKSLLASM